MFKKFWLNNYNLLIVAILLAIISLVLFFNSSAFLPSQEETSTQNIGNTSSDEGYFDLQYQFEPSNYSLAPQTSFSLIILPDQAINLSVYRLVVSFDPDVLSIESAQAGSFFSSPQILRNEIDNQEGRADFSVGIGLDEEQIKPESGNQGSFIILSFRVKSKEDLPSTTINFDTETTFINDQGTFENLDNILKPIIIEAAHG